MSRQKETSPRLPDPEPPVLMTAAGTAVGSMYCTCQSKARACKGYLTEVVTMVDVTSVVCVVEGAAVIVVVIEIVLRTVVSLQTEVANVVVVVKEVEAVEVAVTRTFWDLIDCTVVVCTIGILALARTTWV